MRKAILYIACSMNGRIAKPDGSVDWLEEIPNPDETDYGYTEFYKRIDTTVQGYSTYQQILDWGIEFPYPDKTNYVCTRKQDVKNTKDVTFITENHADFIRELKEQKGKPIWVIGGGQINTLLLNEGLIDEIHVFVMPIILPGGIEVFEGMPNECTLKLYESKSYGSGCVLMKYGVNL